MKPPPGGEMRNLLMLTDEFHQKLIPGRSFNVRDIYSNLTGIVSAVIFCVLLFRNISANIE
jgi:VanZ family protein